MADDKILSSDFYLQFPFRELLKEQMEVIGANPHGLLLWYRGRTTVEFEFDGLRCGGVLGTSPLDHSTAAEDLTKCGMPCTARQVRRWDKRLADQGAIARFRTPVGYRVLVMDSFKFPDGRVKSLPAWARKVVKEAAAKRPESTPRNRDSRIAAVQGRGATGDQKSAVTRPKVGGPIRNTNEIQKKQRLRFQRECLEVSWAEHEMLKKRWPDLDLDDVYEEIAEVQAERGQPVRSAYAFVDAWLQRARGDPPAEGSMPVAEINPEALEFLRKKDGYGVDESLPDSPRP